MRHKPPPVASAEAIHVREVHKQFRSSREFVVALERVNLTVAEDEFFTLLGPSGCGKTTLLRLLAGFESPTEGEIFLFGEPLADKPPHKRPINTVFQHYALFPHMTVAQNVAFGLEMLGQGAAEVKRTVARSLELVQMTDFAARKPAQLSGGQQQRVALARALAPRPKVLLLDEPLSALDLKLRHAMRGELKALQRETGVTFVFVTHDQEEALTMSDRIAVMASGRVQQVGTPTEIYEKPVNRFVADFVGRTNFLTGTVVASREGEAVVALLGRRIRVAGARRPGARVTLVVRPEKIALHPLSTEVAPDAEGTFDGTVIDSTYLGTDTSYRVRVTGTTEAEVLEVRDPNARTGAARFGVGERVRLLVAPLAARVLEEAPA
jgi:spermidine/putrescine transport system ATP-binding protein